MEFPQISCFFCCQVSPDSWSFGVSLRHAKLFFGVPFSMFLLIVHTERPPLFFDLLFALTESTEFWFVRVACGIGPGSSISFVGVNWSDEATVFSFVFRVFVCIDQCHRVRAYARCVCNFNGGSVCCGVGLRALAGVYFRADA